MSTVGCSQLVMFECHGSISSLISEEPMQYVTTVRYNAIQYVTIKTLQLRSEGRSKVIVKPVKSRIRIGERVNPKNNKNIGAKIYLTLMN